MCTLRGTLDDQRSWPFDISMMDLFVCKFFWWSLHWIVFLRVVFLMRIIRNNRIVIYALVSFSYFSFTSKFSVVIPPLLYAHLLIYGTYIIMARNSSERFWRKCCAVWKACERGCLGSASLRCSEAMKILIFIIVSNRIRSMRSYITEIF